MSQRKHLFPVIICLLALTACAQLNGLIPTSQSNSSTALKDTPQSTSQSSAATTNAMPADTTAQIKLVTNFIGADTTVSTKNGFYQLVPNAECGSNILYTDYASKNTVYLCNEPNCTHSTDSCASWLEDSTPEIFTNSRNDCLYLITDENLKQTLWQMNLDGSNRKPLYTLEANESFRDAIAADGENLYMAIHIIESGSNPPIKKLLKLNSQTGKATTLMEYGNQDWLFGAFQDKLLVLYYDGTYFTYQTFSVTNGTQEKIFSYGGDTISNASFARPNGRYLYIFEPQDTSTANVTKLDMETGEQQALCKSVPYFGSESIMVGNFVDNYCFISVYNPNEAYGSENRDFYYMLNCETGETFPITLGYDQGSLYVTMEPIAATEDYYIVNCGNSVKPIVLTATDGTAYQSEIDMIEYALILKND